MKDALDLVRDRKIAQDVTAYQYSYRFPSVFILQATAKPGHTVAELRAAVDEELNRLRTAGPAQADLDGARNRFLAQFVRDLEDLGDRAQLLNRYGAREGRAQVENGARATYSAYNGGPDAYRRYRLARVARTERAIDVAFWKKYRAMAAGRALDFVLCIQGWSPSRTQLSVVPRAATPNSCMRSRRSSATRTIEACHISIARRPTASFV